MINVSPEEQRKTFKYSVFRDENLSWKARGIMAYLLSKPKTWECQIFDLLKNSKHDGITSVRSAMRELVDNEYAKLVSKGKKDNKFLGKHYLFTDTKGVFVESAPTENL